MAETAMTDDQALDALRAALRHPTTAGVNHDPEAFAGLHASLREHFPLLFGTCETVDVEGDALLLRWPGSTDEAPIVLMAHQDVVPIEPTDTWTHPPFDAVVDGEFLWGRGTLDCKGSLVAICCAVERLVAQGATPRRDVWLSFGGDEEVLGTTAASAVRALQDREVEPWFVLDEGGAVATGAFPKVDTPLAVIGLAEKGVADLEVVATGDGGHAATPKRGGAVAKLARAISRVDAHPAPPHLHPATATMLEAVAQVAPAPMAKMLGNASRAPKALAQLLARLGAEPAAMVRTTVAVTTLKGAPANNAIATSASAGLNMRVAVGETVDYAVDRLRRTIKDDAVQVRVLDGHDPSPVSPTDDAYELITATIREVMPDAHPVPYVMNQATDARQFHRVWPRVYRFNPFRMSPEQRGSLHNVDERITVASYLEGVRWYTRLIEQL